MRSVEIKVREGQLSKIIEKRIALQDKATRSITEDIDETGKLRKSINAVYDEESKGISKNFNLRLLTVQEQKDLNKLLQDEKMLITAIAGLKQPQDFLDGKGKAVKDVRTVADVLKDLNKELDFISKKNILINSEKAKASIGALESALDELLKDFGLKTTNPIIVDLAFRINYAKVKLATDELFANIKQVVSGTRQGEKDKLKIVVNVQPIFKTDPAGINKEAFKLGQEINEIVKNTFVDAFSGLGEAIGDALSGVSIGNAFDGIVKSLAGGLKAIGRKIIETNIQLAILKKIGFSNPAVGIAVGVAITALGAALQNAVSKQKAFATGVRNFEGGFAMVGERGPERVFLPKGSSVQPNNELSAFSGGGITLMPSIQYSGDGFRIMLDKVDKRWGRNN